MRALLLDLGNSKIAVALAVDGQIVDRVVEAYKGPGREAALASAYDWCCARIGEAKVDGVAMSSVVPQLSAIWIRLWESRRQSKALDILHISAASALNFELKIESAETVGADRLCNVAGALRRGLSSAVIVDLGTANNFEVIRNGCFVGGLIAPGCVLAHAALLEAGAQLPEIAFREPRRLLGSHTVAAIEAGSWLQGLGGVLYLLHRLAREEGDPLMLATGGVAALYEGDLPADLLHVPDLTLEGALGLLELSLAAG